MMVPTLFITGATHCLASFSEILQGAVELRLVLFHSWRRKRIPLASLPNHLSGPLTLTARPYQSMAF